MARTTRITTDGRTYTALLLTYRPRVIADDDEASRVRSIVSELESLTTRSTPQADMLTMLRMLLASYDNLIETYAN